MKATLDEVVGWVSQLTADGWPAQPDGAQHFLERHDCVEASETVSEEGVHVLRTPVGEGSWVERDGVMVELTVWVTETSPTDREALRSDYEGLKSQLDLAYGVAETSTSTLGAPRSAWLTGGCMVGLDCYWSGSRLGLLGLSIGPDAT